jgi:hypothetical protein
MKNRNLLLDFLDRISLSKINILYCLMALILHILLSCIIKLSSINDFKFSFNGIKDLEEVTKIITSEIGRETLKA